MTRFSRLLLLLALGGSIAFLGYHRLALTDLIFGKGDAYHYFTPLWAARDAALRSGQLPLWTDALFMGAPLLADSQLGTFYPPNWLTVWLPAWTALKVSVFIHVAWAAIGAFLLARRVLSVGVLPAIIAAGVFALGGVVGAHAEQINQLQGIAWMPWAFLSVQRPVSRLRLSTFPFGLAAVLALIALSGHTQTLFITGIGLGTFVLAPAAGAVSPTTSAVSRFHRLRALGRPRLLGLVLLALASVLALVLAAVQLLPTLELTGLSNRQGGFSALAAMAFSWPPNLAARGLLPSLDGQVFGEYVAYLGVVGLSLALWGVFYGGARRWPWLILALAGLVLAFGLYNPLYWLLAELPGFNFFRVPARFLGLFALAGAMLAALGAHTLIERPIAPPRRGLLAVFAILAALALLAVWRSPTAALEVDGEARPTLPTLLLWAGAALLFANAVLLRAHIPRRGLAVFLAVITLGELAIAATNMPHRDLVDPMAATDPRLTSYMLTAPRDATVSVNGPQRSLSISLGYFDTYDHADLLDRYARLGMTERAAKAGLTAAKLKEILAPNFPLLYGSPSADGFGGGLLPTVYYSAFTSLILPDGMPRTLDGRLRELLAQPECFGACVPDRWLKLMGVDYLILDKTYDRFYDDVQFDLGLSAVLAGDLPEPVIVPSNITADQAHLLASSADIGLNVNGRAATVIESRPVDDGLTLVRFDLGPAERIASLELGGDGATVRALTLVDSRTGAFAMLPLGPWQKILSSDIKLYQRSRPVPAAIVPQSVDVLPDDWNGSEAALIAMRDPAFDPAAQVILHGAPDTLAGFHGSDGEIDVVSRSTTRTEYAVNLVGDRDAVVLLNDAYFPGWTAEIDGQPAPLYRADVMFRAAVVPPGSHTIAVEYRPLWLRPLLAFGAAAWVIFGLAWLTAARLSGRKEG